MNKKISQEIFNSIKFLKKGKIILYPTDTTWGIGCHPMKLESIKKIYYIKKRNFNKPMILLVNSLKMLKKIVKVSKEELKLIKITKHPLTIIYNSIKYMFPYLITNKKKIAIRITKNFFCKKLIKKLNMPLISTSANISGDNTPIHYNNININIINKVDYIVNLSKKNKVKYKNSFIVEWNNNNKNWNILRN